MKQNSVKNKLILPLLILFCVTLFNKTIYSMTSDQGAGRYAQTIDSSTPISDTGIEKLVENLDDKTLQTKPAVVEPEPPKFTPEEIEQKFRPLISTLNKLNLDDPTLYRQTARRAMDSGLTFLKDNRTITSENALILFEFVSLVDSKKDHPELINTPSTKKNLDEILAFKDALKELVDIELAKKLAIKPIEVIPAKPEVVPAVPVLAPEKPVDIIVELQNIIDSLGNKVLFIKYLDKLKSYTEGYLNSKTKAKVRSKFFETFMNVNAKLNLVDFIAEKDMKNVYSKVNEIFKMAQDKITIRVQKKKLKEWIKEIDGKLEEIEKVSVKM